MILNLRENDVECNGADIVELSNISWGAGQFYPWGVPCRKFYQCKTKLKKTPLFDAVMHFGLVDRQARFTS